VIIKLPSNLSTNDRYDQFCASLIANTSKVFPTKYVFPTFPLAPGKPSIPKLTFDPVTMKRHYVQYKSALLEFYEYFATPMSPFFTADYEANANRLAQIFARKIAAGAPKLVFGFMGSSVMSGQDNCHGLVLSETFRTMMAKLVQPFRNMQVEVRNMGQNGDGPDSGTQMLCGYDTLGEIDFLVVWYPMIPNYGQGHQILSARLTATRNVPIFNMWTTFGAVEWCIKDGYCASDKPIWSVDFWAFVSGHWGRHGDGRCHYKTREGWPGIFMQNWHLGPLGFQTLADIMTASYLEGLMRAMDLLQQWGGADNSVPTLTRGLPGANLTPVPLSPNLDSINCTENVNHEDSPILTGTCYGPQSIAKRVRLVCFTGYQPRWTPDSDLYGKWYLPLSSSADATNPFENSGVAWKYSQIKGPSRGNGYEAEAYVNHPELNCSAFVDIGFAFSANGVGLTQWLTFRMLAIAFDRLLPAKTMSLLVCSGQRSGAYGPRKWTVQYGAMGHAVGEALNVSTAVYTYQTCLRVASKVNIPKPGEVFGFRFDFGLKEQGGAVVETIALIGDL
jgi:hypothetical protein